MSSVKKKRNFNLKWSVLVLLVGLIIHNLLSSGVFLTRNYGLSLSLNSPKVLFLNIIFVLFLMIWSFKSCFWGLRIVLIGGIINLSDRFFLGYVRDYWSFGWGVVNNLADWLIGIGVLLFLTELLWKK